MNNKNILTQKLAMQFGVDFKEVMEHYTIEDKIYLTDAMINIAQLKKVSFDSIDYDKVNQIIEGLRKKYKNELRPFANADLLVYFNPLMSLSAKNIISAEEFNADENQGLNETEYGKFIFMVLNYLNNLKNEYYLSSERDDKTATNKETTNENKINWLGTQKELGELFVELHKKGWIEEINHQQISNAFTKSNTISQVLKPSQDNRSLENMYEQIYTSKYEPKFDTIRTQKGKK